LDRITIEALAGAEMARLMDGGREHSHLQIFRRPDPRDETDRIGRELVRRMIEAGVVEAK
jgi:hypothetical protein